jgi:hypothetical protein
LRPEAAIIDAVLGRALGVLAVASSGVSAGAMLFIRLVLVPFWQGASPSDFRSWFADHSEGIRRLMVPLGSAAGATSVTTLAVEIAKGSQTRTSWALAASSAAGVGAITFAVNEPANAQFVRQDLDDAETVRLLDRWTRWHNVRVALGLVGTLAGARALARRA